MLSRIPRLYSLYVNREHSSVVGLQLRLRHTSLKVYSMDKNRYIGHNPNIEWYFQSKVGSRVVSRYAGVLVVASTWDTGAITTLIQKHQVLEMMIHFKTLLLGSTVTIQPVKARRRYNRRHLL
ncbi:hypothetical protein TNCV_2929371 [Trichonephila clavipes]|nr:hypothetical protein TNCV_2929371 [Trichonephila clavipes]